MGSEMTWFDSVVEEPGSSVSPFGSCRATPGGEGGGGGELGSRGWSEEGLEGAGWGMNVPIGRGGGAVVAGGLAASPAGGDGDVDVGGGGGGWDCLEDG